MIKIKKKKSQDEIFNVCAIIPFTSTVLGEQVSECGVGSALLSSQKSPAVQKRILITL